MLFTLLKTCRHKLNELFFILILFSIMSTHALFQSNPVRLGTHRTTIEINVYPGLRQYSARRKDLGAVGAVVRW